MAISSDVKLRIYNRALYHLGSRKLASLSENRKPRRVLDEIWGSNSEAVDYALERAGWNFAMRAIQAILDEAVDPQFGWLYAFEKPSDYRRLEAISADPTFRYTYTNLEYHDEAGYWLTNTETTYIKYVSNDDAYGFDSSRWSESFKEFLAAYLAYHACEPITQSTNLRDFVGGEMVRALKFAKSGDSMEEGTKFLQNGSWVMSRSGRGRRGPISRLTDE